MPQVDLLAWALAGRGPRFLLASGLAVMIHTLWVLRERAATHSVMLHSADALEMAIRSRALTQPQPDD